MADKCLILFLRSSRLTAVSLGKQSRLNSTLVMSRLVQRPSPVTSTPKLPRALSLNVRNMKPSSVPDGETESKHRSANSAAPAESPDQTIEDPALFQPFSADEDPEMYKKGTFQYLFENSQFVRTMDPTEREVEGEIIASEGDKVYVDFGCKFHAVVSVPAAESHRIHSGAKVIIQLQDLEMTKHFIGDTKHQSLLEAEAKFVKLLS